MSSPSKLHSVKHKRPLAAHLFSNSLLPHKVHEAFSCEQRSRQLSIWKGWSLLWPNRAMHLVGITYRIPRAAYRSQDVAAESCSNLRTPHLWNVQQNSETAGVGMYQQSICCTTPSRFPRADSRRFPFASKIWRNFSSKISSGGRDESGCLKFSVRASRSSHNAWVFKDVKSNS